MNDEKEGLNLYFLSSKKETNESGVKSINKNAYILVKS